MATLGIHVDFSSGNIPATSGKSIVFSPVKKQNDGKQESKPNATVFKTPAKSTVSSGSMIMGSSYRPTVKIPASSKQMLYVKKASKVNVALCAILKNENNYLHEWVEHYYNLGFTHIYLYDNNDPEGEHPEEVIQDYIDNDFVTIYDVRGMWPALVESYNKFYHMSLTSFYSWIFFCDIDEFLDISNSKYTKINELLADLIYSSFNVIKVCWKYFNDNGLVKVKDNNYSVKRFTKADTSHPNNNQSKMFIRPGIAYANITSPHGALADKNRNANLKCCNSAGHYNAYNGITLTANRTACYTNMCLNHYRFKTIQEYAIKSKRGWPTIYKNGGKAYLNDRMFFEYNAYSPIKHKAYAEAIGRQYIPVTSFGLLFEHKNWGDDINYSALPHIFTDEYLIGLPIKNEPNYAFIGSIINDHYINNNTIIWGAGIDSSYTKLKHTPLQVCAVRGPLSRKALLKHNIECPEVYGDPALLLKYFYNPSVPKKYTYGIIPHFSNIRNPKLNTFAYNRNFKIINLREYGSWKDIINQILSCKYIISESLHGLILAESYGIPNLWINLGDNNTKNRGLFKYHDFFLSLGADRKEPFVMTYNTTENKLKELLNKYKRVFDIDLIKLVNACPLNINPNIITKILNEQK